MIFVVDVVVENEGMINCEYCSAILRSVMLEEKPAHHPLEPLNVALKHTGWMPPAYLYSLAESAKVEGKRIVNSDIN